MNTTPLFLARKILLETVYQKNVSTMTCICFIGIFIGSFSLALITAISHGYQHAIYTQMQGINAQIILRAPGQQPLNVPALIEMFQSEFPAIQAFSPTTMRHVLVQTDDEDTTPSVAVIRAIDPHLETSTSIVAQKIVPPSSAIPLSELVQDNIIIVGTHMARDHGFVIGDTINLLFPQHNHPAQGRKVVFDIQSARIGALFETGIDEVDSSVLYCTFPFLHTLFPDIAVEQINITLTAHAHEQETIDHLKKRTGLEVYSWKDLYPALVSALALEKYVAFFILALILLVASMNIISLLYMQITQKRTDIALLKALGMSNHAISSIFFCIGMSISVIASTCGLLCAAGASWFLHHYPFIKLPDAYYVSTLPIQMDWWIIGAVCGVVLFFSFWALWIPIRKIHSINVSQVLRFER